MPALFNPASLPATITVKVTPKAKRACIKHEVRADGSTLYKVYVNAPPEDGKANAAVLELLAEEMGIAKSRLSVLRGHTSREKVIHISAS